jgi:hypothetical protein
VVTDPPLPVAPPEEVFSPVPELTPVPLPPVPVAPPVDVTAPPLPVAPPEEVFPPVLEVPPELEVPPVLEPPLPWGVGLGWPEQPNCIAANTAATRPNDFRDSDLIEILRGARGLTGASRPEWLRCFPVELS